MDCQTAREMGSRLLDWDLSSQEQADLQLHLTVCPDCRQELDAFYALHQAFTRLRENPVDPPRDLALKVMSQVEAAPPLMLAVRRAKAAFIRRVEEIGLVFKTPGRTRTALSAAALALVAVVAVGSLYLNNLGSLVADNPAPTVTVPAVPAAPAPAPTAPTKPGDTSQPTTTPATPPVQAQLASASSGTQTSVWVNANDLDAINRQLSTVAGQHNADYKVYSLNNAPGGQNKEIVKITAGPDAKAGITDRILSTASAVGRVVNTVTSNGSDGQDVITAFVSGPSQ
ncbi:MAG TPA: zf-HC2 domain-containing protein [Spirochaetia bacterium]|nr:zf-HC2 domain-containing protein [Spirochaetia bacterium]